MSAQIIQDLALYSLSYIEMAVPSVFEGLNSGIV